MHAVLFDPILAGEYRTRIARDQGVGLLLDAWCGAPADRRAAMLWAQGDTLRAALCGGNGWRRLAEGDVVGALRASRSASERDGSTQLLEAESLITAGAVVAGLTRIEALHRRGDPAASVVLTRRRHTLGDHEGAEQAARAVPLHAHAAFTGARAALAGDRVGVAADFVAPFLAGAAPLPEPAMAGTAAMLAASILARRGEHDRLHDFAERLLEAEDLSEDMMPGVVRTAWIAGLGARAWERFDGPNNPVMAAARLELALLSGNAALAERLTAQAGPLGAPAAPALALLRGARLEGAQDGTSQDGTQASPGAGPGAGSGAGAADEVFREGARVHVWRTHPRRWQPWIDAALRTSAQVDVFDLGGSRLPDAEAVPDAALDDGALVGLLEPVPRPVRRGGGSGLWIEETPCQGVGVGHDWPREEDRTVRDCARMAVHADRAQVHVLGTEAALVRAEGGLATVAIAPPGDPFWAGPLPERIWPSMRVVRADSRSGWRGAGERVLAAARDLMSAQDPDR